MGRIAWIGTLLGIVVVVVLTLAWLAGGAEPQRWIEQPLAPPGGGR